MKLDVEARVRFKPRPHRGWEQYAGQTGTIIHCTTDGFYRVHWDTPIEHPGFFNLERVFDMDDLIRINKYDFDAKKKLYSLADYLELPHLNEFYALIGQGNSDAAWTLLAEKSVFERRDLLLWIPLLEIAVNLNWKRERDWAITEISKFKGCFYD
jgi:hypothetical protein